jgi:hypothetical protein
MPFTVQGYADDHLMTAVVETEREALVKAVEWFISEQLSEIAISDGIAARSIHDFPTALARPRVR